MRVALLTALFFAVFAWPAHAQYYGSPPPSDSGDTGGSGEPDAKVDANGDPFMPGSLNFDPAKVSVKVGQVVQWTNTDDAVPHTATEDHGLWDLSGTYGLPGNYGFGPGESVQRAFEAGTHHYYCKVHPDDMKGVVEVPVKLKKLRHHRARATWSSAAPADGQVFDVQRRVNGGPWRTFVKGTRKRRTKFERGARGTRVDVRARLRSADDPKKAIDWSPPARIRG